ncbi:MAG: nucleotidyltransferase domain-containing protein [Oligoflexales bacterium]|nr:nucleotidyltransferase domain-containing protein [Oligoflexales bacterium]
MKFGLNTAAWTELEQLLLAPLKKAGAKVWIFGSRARGDYKEYSDLDVLVEFSGDAPQGLLGSIRMDLEDSSLPIKVDIVERKNLAFSYTPQVEQEKILLL